MKPPTRKRKAETIRVEEIAMRTVSRAEDGYMSTFDVVEDARYDGVRVFPCRVGIILGRMVREGRLRRVRPGVFALPKEVQA